MADRTQKTVKAWPKDVKRPTEAPPILPPETLGVNIPLLMASREPKDVAYLGTMLEDFLKSSTGEFVCRIIHGLKTKAARGPESAEQRIGRIQQLEELLDVFEAYVLNKKQHKAVEEEEREAEVWERVVANGGQMPPSAHGMGEQD